MRWIPIMAVTACLAAGPSAAPAQTEDGAAADVRCLVVISLMAQDQKLLPVAMLGGLYYLGRLDGRDADMDIEGLLTREAKRMKPQDLKSEAKRCGDTMKLSGERLQAVGRRLQSMGARAPT